MKINIIGGSGFIAGVLINRLKLINVLFTVTDKQPRQFQDYPFQKIDIRSKDELQALPKSDYVVHLAAEHQDNVSPINLYYDVNVTGTQNVLDRMDELGISKIIFTSSVAVYGLNKDNPDENHPVDPFNHYGKSKFQAEEVLRAWYNKDPNNRTLIIIRPTVVFGPENRGNVYNLLSQIASGKFLMIGDGKNKKSLAFVENVAAFIEHCIKAGLKGYHLFNYADKPDLCMNDLLAVSEKALNKKIPSIRIPYFIGIFAGMALDTIAKLTRKKFPISAIRVKKFCATTQFQSINVSKTGFQPIISLTEGLSLTIQSITNQSE
jgi:GlcNAc-P-P-Und epimerase